MDEEQIRLHLHSQLETTFPDVGLYYRPPGNLFMERPCIIYEPKEFEPSFANSKAYVIGIRFQITLLSDLPGYAGTRKIFGMLGVVVTSSRMFVNDNVVNDVYTVSVNTIT